jgi:hypothetical protein
MTDAELLAIAAQADDDDGDTSTTAIENNAEQ